MKAQTVGFNLREGFRGCHEHDRQQKASGVREPLR
jgi:hypothetical protein